MKSAPLLLITLLACACSGDAEKPQRTVLRGEAMGTRWSLVLAADTEDLEKIRARVVATIGSVDSAMSTWIDDSEVSRFNRLAAGETMLLSAETAEVVACALQIWRDSGGAFDMTVGSTGNSADLVFEPVASTLGKTVDGVTIDLSAIAKGYAVDRVAAELDALGVNSYLVEIGGELKAKGRTPEGDPWTVGIERPMEGESRIAGTVELNDQSIATSGNYRQRRHLIDPDSGAAIQRPPMAVCVLHDSAMVADGWATALFVGGVDEGIPLANEQKLAVAFLPNRGEGTASEIVLSDAFQNSGAIFGAVKD